MKRRYPDDRSLGLATVWRTWLIPKASKAEHGKAASTDKAINASAFGDRIQRSSGLTSVTTMNDVSSARTTDGPTVTRLDSCSCMA